MNVEPPLRGGGEAALADKLGQSRFTGTTRRWRCCLVLFHLEKWTMWRLSWRPAGIHNNFVLELTLLGEPGGLPGDRLIGGGSVPESLAASFKTAAAAVAACLFGELVLMFVVLVVVPFWLLLLVRLLCRPAVLGTPPPLPTTLSLSSCCSCCFC